ncbi:hypothetical protein [Jannaschia sp. CCS1]|uniref:hypothetical protein n=1 Tax=Jannaschia sp. (strain CCS1) TaxID=290400 RepID=UPI000053A907|nr:hypothetical protein [Jannaschia sp. CCS1]ABD54720.1 hypothetical protein Jann_1803 [Jannaschia sp. CCS1]
MRAALACALCLAPLPATADGPALAHLTVAGTTIALTEVAPIEPGQPMSFAQMHLGFPLPPILHLTLMTTDGAMEVRHLSLNTATGTSDGTGTPLGPETFLWFPLQNALITEAPQQLRIEADALSRTPLGQVATRPVLIEIQFTSP